MVRSRTSLPARLGVSFVFEQIPISEACVFSLHLLKRQIFVDTIEEIKQILKQVAINQQETRAEFEDIAARFRETDNKINKFLVSQKEYGRKLAEQGKQIGGIGEKFGSFTEGLAYPSLQKTLLNRYGIDNTAANFVQNFPDGRQVEFDAFGFTNGAVNNAAIVEVKSSLQSKHVYKFRETLERFRLDFPGFADRHLYGILATPGKVSKELREEVFANGLHLARIHDQIFDLDENPQAIDWNGRKGG